MSDRILGIYDARRGNWERRIYLHSVARDGACVNGISAKLALCGAGTPFPQGADYVIVTPPSFEPERERLVSIGTGGFIWVDRDAALHVWVPGFAEVSSRIKTMRRIRAAVLTVSDKGSRGERKDTSGAALVELVEPLGAEVVISGIVPDERGLISGKLKEWADGGQADLILTTGGTGLSRRDVTPEAIADIGERAVPGFGELMRAKSMASTPRGFLSRSLAVTRGGALIVAFPGSERAVRQCFDAVAPAVRHAVEMLCGWEAECARHPQP
ncbi:MAG: MogA/MoaB family molybdenum cofactor biosynthesis protein [Synergistaceae bacterium]|jgi:molybdenum cofactor synthesis domain-containing protein|nr:MogA/MoaB family molybdenum cofactor biosynthesis protein [Synergistaceae bacterium]